MALYMSPATYTAESLAVQNAEDRTADARLAWSTLAGSVTNQSRDSRPLKTRPDIKYAAGTADRYQRGLGLQPLAGDGTIGVSRDD